jgi:hypothetical protein
LSYRSGLTVWGLGVDFAVVFFADFATVFFVGFFVVVFFADFAVVFFADFATVFFVVVFFAVRLTEAAFDPFSDSAFFALGITIICGIWILFRFQIRSDLLLF